MKMNRCFGFVMALAITAGSLCAPSLAVEIQTNAEPVSAIERVSGWFNETVSAGKVKPIGSAMSFRVNEIVNFDADYSPSDASVDFGVLDSDNAFYYINVTTGTVDGGVAIPKTGWYTPAIRNNSSEAVNVHGSVDSYKPSSK